MKKNGFTLTEMIAVIVIIGIILLVTIPVMSILFGNSKEEKYMFYVETVEKALYSYGDLEFPMSKYKADGVTPEEIEISLDDLINNNYLKKFNEDGVTVSNSTKFKITKANGKVTIVSDNEGTIGGTNSFSLKFTKTGEPDVDCTKTSC